MKKLTVKTISSLEKILPGTTIPGSEFDSASCLLGERFSYQIAVIADSLCDRSQRVNISVESDLPIKIYEIGYVPVTKPCNYIDNKYDNRYITRQPGLLPDILTESDGTVAISGNMVKCLWVSAETAEKSGIHTIKISFCDDEGCCGESTFELDVINAALPKQALIFTEWLHCDCISSIYGIEPLCEKHWEYIEKYIQTAAENGINMILTPIFTPPLDTQIGGERPTVQLVDISLNGGKYSFVFDKLARWLEICKSAGIEYLEMAHLFTQWGAMHAPKIIVTENGHTTKKFGWHTESESDEYLSFLGQFLPQLAGFLSNNWDKSKIYFHISDEPKPEHCERYGHLYNFVKNSVPGFHLMDAISEYEFYENGFSDTPVCTIKTIDSFIKHKTENLWGYYCCSEGDENLSNRFISMPSYRNRIIGSQLYKFNIKGFLHWGYNFYYSQNSTKMINPFITNDADGAFPAGDSFSVYPGADGPIPSIRLFVFFEALQDLRAMNLLESYIGRAAVVKLIDNAADTALDFTDYPAGPEFVLNLRKTINNEIKKYV